MFRVWLKYGADKKPVFTGLKRVSKPGLRVYTKRNGDPDGARRPGHQHIVYTPGPDDRPRGFRKNLGGEVFATSGSIR